MRIIDRRGDDSHWQERRAAEALAVASKESIEANEPEVVDVVPSFVIVARCTCGHVSQAANSQLVVQLVTTPGLTAQANEPCAGCGKRVRLVRADHEQAQKQVVVPTLNRRTRRTLRATKGRR